MKVKELIKELEAMDQDADVVVGNVPIYFVEQLPYYYDGRMGRLIQDKTISGYNIVGYTWPNDSPKVSLQLMGLEDCLENDPDLPVDTSPIEAHSRQRYDDRVADARSLIKTIYAKIESEGFAESGTHE